MMFFFKFDYFLRLGNIANVTIGLKYPEMEDKKD
jgi:hypothetical protein